MPAMLDLLPLPLHPQGPGHWQPPRGEALNPCRTLKACSAFVLGPVVGFFLLQTLLRRVHWVCRVGAEPPMSAVIVEALLPNRKPASMP
ncbi:hypothetical protein SPH9361_04425 [Sphingobium sp. CECT 9361]|nr:hypothetical protein SPH9361_04425 [Sphingobium sp. CECT 9361]